LARRVPSNPQWDAGVRGSGRQRGSNAKEGRSLDVDRRSLDQTYPSTGVGFNTNNEEDNRGERSGTDWERLF
jgi:hypothetical protein